MKTIFKSKVRRPKVFRSWVIAMASFAVLYFCAFVSSYGFTRLLEFKSFNREFFILGSITAGLAIIAYGFSHIFRTHDKIVLESVQAIRKRKPLRSRFRRRSGSIARSER